MHSKVAIWTMAASLCAGAFAQAGDDWTPIAIKAFMSDSGPSMFNENCAGKTGARFEDASGKLKDIAGAEISEGLSCVKFNYKDQIVYVRSSAVESDAAKTSTVKACVAERVAMAMGAVEAATMGAGDKAKCK